MNSFALASLILIMKEGTFGLMELMGLQEISIGDAVNQMVIKMKTAE